MTAPALVTALRHRGVTLTATDDRLRARPTSAIAADDRAALTAQKADVIAFLADVATMVQDGTATQLRAVATTLSPEQLAQLEVEAAAGGILPGLLLAAVNAPEPAPSSPAAVLIFSARAEREVWVARDADAVVDLEDEIGDRPVFLAAELSALRDLDDMALRAVCDAKVAMPGTRVVTDSGEALTPARGT